LSDGKRRRMKRRGMRELKEKIKELEEKTGARDK
jgi:hypothetical protein